MLTGLRSICLNSPPQDEKPIREFIEGIRICIPFDIPSKKDPLFTKIGKQTKTVFNFISKGKKMQEWMNITAEEFSNRFKDPTLRDAFKEIWVPEFSMFFMLFTFAYLHNKNAGYPIGGSMPMSKALEKRYLDLGGVINYKSKVKKIITQDGAATGIVLEDGKIFKSLPSCFSCRRVFNPV